MRKILRRWAIKQGLIEPASIKEAQEIFKFPVKLKPRKLERLSPFVPVKPKLIL